MSNPATNFWGHTVSVGDFVTILGAASAISGTGVKASVTVATKMGDSFTAQAGDCNGPMNPTGTAQSTDIMFFGLYDQISVNGQVTAVTNGPTGPQGVLTITLGYSGLSITCSSGAVDSPGH